MQPNLIFYLSLKNSDAFNYGLMTNSLQNARLDALINSMSYHTLL